MMHGSGHDDLALAARQNLLGEVANGDLGQSVELVDKIGSVGMLDEEGEQQQSFAESFSQDEREETNQSRSMQPPTDDHLVEQRERNAEMLLQEDASITIIQNFPQPKTKPTSALSVSEHLYQATLAKNKALETQILHAKIDKENREMEECTFQPLMATSGKNFSHQDRHGSSFFDRN